MERVKVWAPAVEAVAVALADGRRLRMIPEGQGWHAAVLPEDAADDDGHVDYGFCLDGGDPLPDPRSRWQPAGVHGPSRLFDTAKFAWHDDGFRPVPLADAVIYEIHTGTFTGAGTFRSAVERLDDLVALGVTHVELMPVAAFAGRHGWGYDGVDLYAPHPAYGDPVDLQHLVDEAHQRGLAVLLDVVYNHLGPEGNYLSRFGPYFTDRYVTPWGDAVNLDGPDSDEVRRFFLDNALMWLRDYHVDGLRLDAMQAAIDTSAVHFLEQLRHEVDELAEATGRLPVLTAEYEGNDPRVVRPTELGGYGLDAQWNDDVHHALHTALTGESTSYYEDYRGIEDLVRCLNHGYAYAGRWSPHRRRTVGREPLGVTGNQMVASLQNHDQVGNRAAGERIADLAGYHRQKVAAALVLTGPFVPLLFQGEDWAASSPFPYFADHTGELADAVRRGRLAEFAAFGWSADQVADPEDEATFGRARLDWAERDTGVHADMALWYRTLVALRRSRPELRDGRFDAVGTEWDPDRGVLVVQRGDISVVAALGGEAVEVKVASDRQRALLAASAPDVALTDTGVHLPPDRVAIIGPSAPSPPPPPA